MMKDFNINYGLSTELFIDGQVNPDLIIEAGCWYLCTDTAELFLGIQAEEGLILKQINDVESHPVLNEVKSKVETVLPTVEKVEEEIVPTVEELKTWVDNKDFLQHIDLNGYATEEFVNAAVSGIRLPESEIYKVDFNTPNFTEAINAFNSGKILVLVNAAPDTNSYAIMNYVSDRYITFTKFLMSRSETYGAFNTYYLSADSTWEVAKEVKLNKVEITAEGNLQVGKQTLEVPSVVGLATEEFVNQKIAEAELADKDVDLSAYYTKSEVESLIPDTSNFVTMEDVEGKGYLTEHQEIGHLATKEELQSALEAIEHPTIDLNDYALKSEVPDVSDFITMQDVESKNYLTALPEHTHNEYLTTLPEHEHEQYLTAQSLEAYAKKEELFSKDYNELTNRPEIPSIEGLANTEYVDTKIAEIIVPDIGHLATKIEVEEAIANIEVKANDIPFTSAKYVAKAFGGFTVGDDLNGLTVAQLFAKLLELTDTPIDAPEEPGTESDTPIKDEIITNNLTIYQADDEGNLVEVPYTKIQFTEETAKVAPVESGFYEIKDASENVLEYGYQHTTEPQNAMFYVVALPSDIILGVNAELKTWDAMSEQWVEAEETVLTNDFDEIAAVFDNEEIEIPAVADGYTLWADLSDINAGSIYRIIIKEGV